MAPTLSPEFTNAAEVEAKKLPTSVGSGELAKMYVLYKIAKEETASLPKSSSYNPMNRDYHTFAPWKALSKENAEKKREPTISSEEAQTQYIAYIEELKQKYGVA